jgi:hypothetical protein
MDQITLVQFPIRAVSDEPFFPRGVVADIRPVFGEQAEGVGRVRKLDKPLFKLGYPQIDAFIPNLFFHRFSRVCWFWISRE